MTMTVLIKNTDARTPASNLKVSAQGMDPALLEPGDEKEFTLWVGSDLILSEIESKQDKEP